MVHPQVGHTPIFLHLAHHKALHPIARPPAAAADAKVMPAGATKLRVDICGVVGRVDVSSKVEDVHVGILEDVWPEGAADVVILEPRGRVVRHDLHATSGVVQYKPP